MNSIRSLNKPPSHGVPFFPGMAHSQFMRFIVPSGFFVGTATKPNGWSFLQAFLSWASLLRAIPDMFASLEEPGRTCDEQRYLRALRPSPHAWPSLRLDSEEQANEGPRPPHRLSGHASAWGLHGGRASWGAPPRPVAALPSLSCNSGWSDRDRDITRRGRSKTGTSRGPV